MKKTQFILWLTILVLSFVLEKQSLANGLSVNLSSKMILAQGITSENQGNEKSSFIITPDIEYTLNDNTTFTMIWQFNTVLNDGLQLNDLDTSSYMAINKPSKIGTTTNITLREFYLETPLGENYLTLGKQQVVWGKSDGLKILDIINPQSFSEFILPEFQDSRIPLWMANIEVPLSNGHDLQFIWVFDTSRHVLPKNNATFALTSPRIRPTAPRNANITFSESSSSSLSLKNTEFGMRWGAFIDGWDISVNYFNHFHDFPVLFQKRYLTENNVNIDILPEYKRSQLLGGTFSNTFGDFTVRGEMGYVTNKHYLVDDITDDDGIHQSNELSYVLGVDWYGLSDALFSVQFFQSRLIHSHTHLTRPNTDSTVSLLGQKYFLNETLKAEFLLLKNLHEEDGLFRPKVSYDYSDQLILSLSADIFHGEKSGLFGQFKDKNRIVFSLQYDI